jgi:hypothetical protein
MASQKRVKLKMRECKFKEVVLKQKGINWRKTRGRCIGQLEMGLCNSLCVF